jgi:hypothetical protein
MNARRRTLGIAVVLVALAGATAPTSRAQSPGETPQVGPAAGPAAPAPTPSFRRNPKAFLQAKGFDVSFSWADIYQGAISGDPEDLSEHSGRIALGLTIDGEKIGLWRRHAVRGADRRRCAGIPTSGPSRRRSSRSLRAISTCRVVIPPTRQKLYSKFRLPHRICWAAWAAARAGQTAASTPTRSARPAALLPMPPSTRGSRNLPQGGRGAPPRGSDYHEPMPFPVDLLTMGGGHGGRSPDPGVRRRLRAASEPK